MLVFYLLVVTDSIDADHMHSGNTVPFEDSAGPTRKNSWWSLKTALYDGILACMATLLLFLWEMYGLMHPFFSNPWGLTYKGSRRIRRESLPILDIGICRLAIQ